MKPTPLYTANQFHSLIIYVVPSQGLPGAAAQSAWANPFFY